MLRERKFKTGHGLSPSTLRQYDLQLETVANAIGDRVDVGTIPRKQIVQFLDELPATASARYRSLLVQASFHELRAFGADEMRLSGEKDETVQLLLGHADKRTTQLYLERHGERWAEVLSA